MDKKRKDVTTAEAKKVIGLKSTAYREYLSARLLTNNHFFQQAAIMMTTCLEKEMKAYLFTIGESFKWIHDLEPLYEKLNAAKPEFAKKLNAEFFKALSNIYKTRYYDQLIPGYNWVFVKNKFLAEFDYSYAILEPMLRIKPARDKEISKTKYELDTEEKSEILFTNNYVVNKMDKDKYLTSPDLVYEFRIASTHEIFEAQYPIPYNREEEKNKFLYDGLREKSTTQFQASHAGYPKNELDALYKMLGIEK